MPRPLRFDDWPLGCLIIGAGPAEITVALCLRRFNRQAGEKLAQQDLQVDSGEIVGLTREAEQLDTRVLGRVTHSRVGIRRLLLATGVVGRVQAVSGLHAMRRMNLWTTNDEDTQSQAAFLAALEDLQPLNAATTDVEAVVTDDGRSARVLSYPVMGVQTRQGWR